MFPLKYLIGVGGVAVAGTGAGVGIYYGTKENKTKTDLSKTEDGGDSRSDVSPKEPEAAGSSGPEEPARPAPPESSGSDQTA